MSSVLPKTPWAWADYGFGPVLVEAHGKRRVVLSVTGPRTSAERPYLAECDDGGRLVDLDPAGPLARLLANAADGIDELRRAYTFLAIPGHFWLGRATVEGQAFLSRVRDLLAAVDGVEEEVIQTAAEKAGNAAPRPVDVLK